MEGKDSFDIEFAPASNWKQASKTWFVFMENTAKELWERAQQYFLWCDQHAIPVKKVITAGKEAGTPVYEVKTRPYNIKGLCVHCGIMEDDLRKMGQAVMHDSDYYRVIRKILYIIHDQVITYAMIGEFSPVFSTKVLNIDKPAETVSDPIKIEIVHGLPSLSSSENEILEKLEKEKPLLENGGFEIT